MELWFTEKHTPHAGIVLKCSRTLYSGRSRFQQIDVVETLEFGRMLLLDGLVMTTEKDEFIYHEMLVHPPMHYHGRARDVLVIGGGDGGAVRELLRYPFVEHVILCEIDREVVSVAKEFFPELSSGLSDDRVEVAFEDGSVLLQETRRRFDMILVDSTDPIGAAKALFSRKFYGLCRQALKEDGILCAQSESPVYHADTIGRMRKDMKGAGFGFVRTYTAPVPTYPGGYWSWTMAGPGDFVQDRLDGRALSEHEYEGLGYFNTGILKAAFCLPNFVKKALTSP